MFTLLDTKFEQLKLLCESEEELHFLEYIKELNYFNLIKDISRGESIELIPEVSVIIPYKDKKGILKSRTKKILNKKSYTPDYVIVFNRQSIYFDKILIDIFPIINNVSDNGRPNGYKVYIDVKGSYNQHNSSNTIFSIVQKLLYNKRNIYCYKIVPQELFEKTFTPMAYVKTKTGKDRKLKWNVKTVTQYLNNE
jgi:hypothetical protein